MKFYGNNFVRTVVWLGFLTGFHSLNAVAAPRTTLQAGADGLAEGTLLGNAQGEPVFRGDITIENENKATLPDCGAGSGELCVQGALHADLTGEIPRAAISDNRLSLAAGNLQGAFDWRQGGIYPLNLAREILGQAAAMPGMERIKNDLGGPQPLIAGETGTPFEVLRGLVTIHPGVLHFSEVLLKSASYLVEGEGDYHEENGRVAFYGRLVLLAGGSARLTRRIPALARLQNEAGRLVFPFSAEGTLKNPRVKAELGALAQDLLDSYRHELIQNTEKRRQSL